MRFGIRGATLLALAFVVGSCSDNGVVGLLVPNAPITAEAASTAELGEQDSPQIVITEIMNDPNTLGEPAAEWFEVFNAGMSSVNMKGWRIRSNGTAESHVISNDVVIASGGYAVFARSVAGPLNGLTTVQYVYGATGNIQLNNSNTDWLVLADATGISGAVIDTVAWAPRPAGAPVGASLTPNGASLVVVDVAADNTVISGNPNWQVTPPTVPPYTTNNRGTPGSGSYSVIVVGPITTVTVTPNSATIVQNAQQQFSAVAFDGAGNRVTTARFDWTSSSPDDASISTTGLVTGVRVIENVTITATAPNGVFGTASLRIDAAPPPPTIVINELMAEPANASGGATWGEWFEVHNYGTAPLNLKGWTIASGGTSQPDHVIGADLVVPAGGFAVLGRGNDPTRNGGVTLDYNYFVGTATTIWLDNNDFLELRDVTGVQVDRVQWTSVSRGVTRALRDAAQDNSDAGSSNWGYSTAHFGDGDFGTPRLANGPLSDTPPLLPGRIAFTGRDPSADPALPVGFQDQLFATVTDASGATDTRPVTWTSLTPDIASIDQRGVMTALGAGTATVRATAADGITTAAFSLPTRIASASTTAQYGANLEFGVPKDANASDDFLVTYPQYAASYNKTKGTPNWVSYNIDATHFGPEDRCDCFTFDQNFPADFSRYTTADYTGAGTFHGYGIDRGHLARSFDRTSGSLDNAQTFLFTNIIPQAADNNQGPWSNMENYLGDLARLQNREIYVIAGVAGSKGTVKDEGKITIPTHVWKVAVIMPRNHGLANVNDPADIQVVAAIMPNDPGIRNVDWESTYKTTVDAVEALSGYNLLDLLPDQVEIAVESNTKAPIAVADGPYTSAEGTSVTMSAASSSDPDGDLLTYRWELGDGTVKTGVSISHTYMQDGVYTVSLTTTDSRGLIAMANTTTTVSNVAPVVAMFAGATLLPGETYAINGSFTDPGADRWTATVDYGDGSGQRSLFLTAKSFSLSHTYATPGAFTVTVRVSDDDVTTTRQQSVVVQTPAQGARNVVGAVDALVTSGALNTGNANALTSTLNEAVEQLQAQKITPAVNQLEAFINQVDALERSDRLSSVQAAPLRTGAQRVIQSVSP